MLANKYRPKTFDEVTGQDVTVTILKNQLKNSTYSHAISFIGPSGSGKTTCARIFANEINGEIFEYDCATHNGVADIKDIIEQARTKSLIYEYKVFILDECHTLSSAAWPALLITLEENLPNAIFILCTTDSQKIPNTIISRVQTYNFLPLTDTQIFDRLNEICKLENISIEENALKTIAHFAKGSLRQALTYLDKCILFGNLDNTSVCKVLNIVSYDIMQDLTVAINSKDTNKIIDLVNLIYNNGYELHQFVKQYLDWSVENHQLDLMEMLLTLINEIRYDETPKSIIIARFITKGGVYV